MTAAEFDTFVPLLVAGCLLSLLAGCTDDPPLGIDYTATDPVVQEAQVGDSTGALTFNPVALTDRQVLTAFYHAMGGDGWDRSDNWLTAKPLVEWKGIGWDSSEGRVDRVDLGNNNVVGELTPLLTKLEGLRLLALPGNPRLTGRITREFARMEHLRRVLLPHSVCVDANDAMLREWVSRVVEGAYPCPSGRARQLPRVIMREDGNGVSLRLPDGYSTVTSRSSDIARATIDDGWLVLEPASVGDAIIALDSLEVHVTVRQGAGTFGIDVVMGQPFPLNFEPVLMDVVRWYEWMLDGSHFEEQAVGTCVLRGPSNGAMVRASTKGFLLVTRYRPRGRSAAVGGPCDALSNMADAESNSTIGRPPATGGLEPSDALVHPGVFRHEMGHALGLAGLVVPSHPGLVRWFDGARYFTGPLATREWRRASGDSAAVGVPIDGGSHWPLPDLIVGYDARCLADERKPNAISMYALMDVGYVVHESKIVRLDGPTVADHCG